MVLYTYTLNSSRWPNWLWTGSPLPIFWTTDRNKANLWHVMFFFKLLYFNHYHSATALVGQSLISHSDTPHSVGLLWHAGLWYPWSRIRSRAKPLDFFGWKNPQYAFLQKGSKAICPMSQICGMSKNPITYRGSQSYRLNYQTFLACFHSSLTEDSSVTWHRAPLEMTDETKWWRTKGLLA
jgi:hypothetical protein